MKAKTKEQYQEKLTRQNAKHYIKQKRRKLQHANANKLEKNRKIAGSVS